MATAGTLEIEVVLNGKKVKLGFDELRKRLGLVNKTALKTNKIFGKLAKYATIGFLTKMALDTAKLNRELGLMADRTGMSFEAMSKMRNAFKATGGDAKVLDRVVNRISSGIARLSMGDASFISGMASMGINAIGKKPDEILAEVADKIVEYKGMGLSDAEVFEMMRSVIPEMNDILYNALKGGSQQWLEAQEKAKALNNEQRKSLDRLNQAWSSLTTNLETVYDKIISLIAPVLEDITLVLDKIAQFGAEHEVVSAIALAIIGLGTAIKGLSIAGSVATGLGGLATSIAALGKFGIYGAAAGGVGYGLGYGGTYAFNWLSDLFSSDEVKAEKRDNELATQANSMHFGSIEEKLKWLANQGSEYYQNLYDRYMEKNYPDSSSTFRRAGVNYSKNTEMIPLFENEITKATSSDDPIIIVDFNNEITDNGGEYEIESSVDVSKGGTTIYQGSSMNTITGGN